MTYREPQGTSGGFDSSKYVFEEMSEIWTCQKYDRVGILHKWMADKAHPLDWFTMEGVPLDANACLTLHSRLKGHRLRLKMLRLKAQS